MIFDELQSRFWAPANVNWCEPDYAVHPQIAEFWNTVTSLVMLLLGVFGAAAVRWCEARVRAEMWSLAAVGAGSALFHGSLLYGLQLLDELPMLWGTLFMIHAWSRDLGPSWPRKGLPLAATGVAVTVACKDGRFSCFLSSCFVLLACLLAGCLRLFCLFYFVLFFCLLKVVVMFGPDHGLRLGVHRLICPVTIVEERKKKKKSPFPANVDEHTQKNKKSPRFSRWPSPTHTGR
jgi:hypothetical protein